MFQKISLQELVDFTKSLSIMLMSGITINDALYDLSKQAESPYFSKVIDRVRVDVENGVPLSKSFGKEQKVFGDIFVSLVKAGEESGTLQNNLQFLADWLGRSADLKREMDAATMYPKLVFGAALLLGGGLTVFILPKLVPLFTSLKVELPLITKMLLYISLWLQNYWYWGILAILGFVAMIRFLNTIYPIRRFFHRIHINLPFVGNLLKYYQRALLAQLFYTLLKSGLSLNHSVSIISQASTNIIYKESLDDIHQKLIEGTNLSESMKLYNRLYPNMMISIVAVGENSGSLVQSFEYLSEFFTKEVNIQTKKYQLLLNRCY